MIKFAKPNGVPKLAKDHIAAVEEIVQTYEKHYGSMKEFVLSEILSDLAIWSDHHQIDFLRCVARALEYKGVDLEGIEETIKELTAEEPLPPGGEPLESV